MILNFIIFNFVWYILSSAIHRWLRGTQTSKQCNCYRFRFDYSLKKGAKKPWKYFFPGTRGGLSGFWFRSWRLQWESSILILVVDVAAKASLTYITGRAAIAIPSAHFATAELIVIVFRRCDLWLRNQLLSTTSHQSSEHLHQPPETKAARDRCGRLGVGRVL